jgi:hypothetical protein
MNTARLLGYAIVPDGHGIALCDTKREIGHHHVYVHPCPNDITGNAYLSRPTGDRLNADRSSTERWSVEAGRRSHARIDPEWYDHKEQKQNRDYHCQRIGTEPKAPVLSYLIVQSETSAKVGRDDRVTGCGGQRDPRPSVHRTNAKRKGQRNKDVRPVARERKRQVIGQQCTPTPSVVMDSAYSFENDRRALTVHPTHTTR